MKKALSLLLACLMLCSLFVPTAFAEGEETTYKEGVTVFANPDSPTGYSVTYVYKDAEAESVALSGSKFQFGSLDGTRQNVPVDQWEPELYPVGSFVSPQFPMTKVTDDLWAVTLNLPSGAYPYYFVVNGNSRVRVFDPTNMPLTHSVTGRMCQFCMSYVPFDSEKQLIDRTNETPRTDGQTGTVETVVFDDAGTERPLAIYLPYGYDAEREEPYKVAYISHGGGGMELEWMNEGCIPNIVDNLVANGEVEPFIVVTMDNTAFGWNYPEIIRCQFDSIIPYMEANYNVSTETWGRAYGGLSMGSITSQNFLFTHATDFGYFGPWSAGEVVDLTQYENLDKPVIMMGGGVWDFGYERIVDRFLPCMDAVNLSYMDVTTPGTHDWAVWPRMFEYFAKNVLWRDAVEIGTKTVNFKEDGTAFTVDAILKGDETLSSVRVKLDSALPIADVTSDYEYEYNPNNGMIVVYNDEFNPGDVLFTISYDLGENPDYEDGKYPIDIEIIDATTGTERAKVSGVPGKIIIKNAYPKGDVNKSGVVSNADLIMIARYLVGLQDFNDEQKEIADFNEDGVVDNVDLVLIARAIVEEHGTPYPEESYETRGTYSYVVNGFDWGGGVTKIILDVSKDIDSASIDADDFQVVVVSQSMCGTSTSTRQVTNAYASDAEGNPVDAATTRNIAIEMYVSPNDGGAFSYNIATTSHNEWPVPYENYITFAEGASVTSGGKEINTLTIDINATAIISPLSDQFEQKSYTGADGIELAYGIWSPAEDTAKNPLIIWLHGAGEGGTDNRVVTMGNKVENLITDDIQKFFRSEGVSGAYVLTPQSPTMWMDMGGNNYTNDGSNIYNDTLFELIDTYVKGNPDIDTDRIYVGGCSNGGYMTMSMILLHPDYFAAAYPVCEAYSDEWISDEQIESIKNIPIWFTQAKNDTTVDPNGTTVPTFARLQEAGAKDVYFSFFDDVHDTTGNYKGNDGEPYQYMGHWSWIYTLNNECVREDGTTIMEWMAAQHK